MSTVFTPGWSWKLSNRVLTPNPINGPTSDSFAPKVANNNMNSFHLVDSVYGQPAYVQVKCSKVTDIYENTGVTVTSQMPVKTGKKVDLTFYGLSKVEMTQGTVTKDYLAPLGMSLSYWIPETYLDTDEAMNGAFSVILHNLLEGVLLKSTTVGEVTTVVEDFMQVLKGVLNLPALCSTEEA